MKAEPRLDGGDLRRICDFIYQRTGMLFGESKRYYVERRVADRMRSRGIHDFAAYFGKLEKDAAEAEKLVNAFTVNETYFYREENQLKALSRTLLPEIVQGREPGAKVRIWSAPCATGEEPYSIAIWLLENWAMVDAYNIEIVGSDIDTRVVSEAIEGEYSERAVMRLPERLLGIYFEPRNNRRWRLIRDIRESVTFTSVNLIDAGSVRAQARFDIVFCRNLFIYFDEASRLLAAQNMFASLTPGGFVCLGHSESLSRIMPEFEMRNLEEAVVYQRPRVEGEPYE